MIGPIRVLPSISDGSDSILILFSLMVKYFVLANITAELKKISFKQPKRDTRSTLLEYCTKTQVPFVL